ncbi:glycosyltransferase [Ruminococcus albus]|uniref:Glycosyltransferase involved in cell wall bisynthesis n=1 Tax=Ruminococcus albus TaxID=1264 RepID=A0A1I1CUU4_RUMAL|nr:glycosyltransferase [Ruminococcus albus]SFB66294.1 Glycosyltransferase involved in cell wall bisynthesis [Ruminococcus albus]
MKVIYIGTIVPNDYINNYPSTSVAANNFQSGLLKGIAKDKKIKLKIYSVPARRGWPGKSSVFFSRNENLPFYYGLNVSILSFINIKFYKEISIRFHTFCSLLKELCLKSHEKCCIISYNGDGRLTASIRFLRHFLNFKYICMVVDPPEYKGTTSRKGMLWKKIYQYNKNAYMKSVYAADALVVLNKSFITINKIKSKYIVIDGGISLDEIETIKHEKPRVYYDKKNFNIVFTGTLHEHSGVLRLIDMFEQSNIQGALLHIYGSGVDQVKVKQRADRNTKIIYHGPVDFNTAISAQYEADLLICPNPITHPINQVAFPSKLIEYLGSNTPILVTKLPSIGLEYNDAVVFYDDTLDDFKVKVKMIMNMSNNALNVLTENAMHLAHDSKEWDAQSKKLLKLIKDTI